jgi:hypothetical protein
VDSDTKYSDRKELFANGNLAERDYGSAQLAKCPKCLSKIKSLMCFRQDMMCAT